MNQVLYKKCTKCGETLELSRFYKYNKGYLGTRSICKCCKYLLDVERFRTHKGIIHRIYGNQIKSSKKRGHKLPTYSKNELYAWLITSDMWHQIYNNWVNNNYNLDLTPSIDRLDDSIGYSFDNIQVTTWYFNNIKGRTAPKRKSIKL